MVGASPNTNKFWSKSFDTSSGAMALQTMSYSGRRRPPLCPSNAVQTNFDCRIESSVGDDSLQI